LDGQTNGKDNRYGNSNLTGNPFIYAFSLILFNKLENEKYHALVTIATGHLSDTKADNLGLVPTHAYAVLGNL
jgi:hypothetical protein